MSLDPNKTYLTWNGSEFPNSSNAQFKAPAGSSIDWGDGTVETFETASETVNTHTYTDGLTEHTIAISGLTEIVNGAFWSLSNLTGVTIGNDVTRIGDGAFHNCSSLTNVIIPNSVTSISNSAFYNCSSLTSVTIPDSVTIISNAVFGYCSSLTSVNIPDGVTHIGDHAFLNCSSLMSIEIPASVTSIRNGGFYGCTRLQSIVIFAETPPTLGTDAIPSTVQSIYVTQSSKAAYQSATNWNAVSEKIVSDNLYLSFIRFNQKNKDYIDEKVNDSAVGALKEFDGSKETGDLRYTVYSQELGKQTNRPFSAIPKEGALAMYGSGSSLQTNLVRNDMDCANKKYVDDKINESIVSVLNTEV